MTDIKVLYELGDIIRIREWVEKLQVTFAAALILLIFSPNPPSFFKFLIVLGIYQCFLLSYGYVINSCGDLKQDIRAGKLVKSYFFEHRLFFVMLGFLAAGALGIPLAFAGIEVKILGTLNFLLATFYSLNPLRFKERGMWGIIVASITQRPIPFLLFTFFIPPNQGLAIILFGWLLLYSILYMLAHQIHDYTNDKKAGVNTWALKVGRKCAKNVSILVCVLIMLIAISPIFILPLSNALAITLIILAFSKNSIEYFIDSLKSV